MRIALDTNVVLRVANKSDPDNQRVTAGLLALLDRKAELCIPAQVIYEFWVVATRPATVNGLGLSPEATHDHVRTIRAAYTVVPDPPDVLDRWLELCRSQ